MSEALFPARGNRLQGKQILITRPREAHSAATGAPDQLQLALTAEGAQVHWLPLVTIQPVPSMAPDSTTAALANEIDWLFFTSQNAVRYFFDSLSPGDGIDGFQLNDNEFVSSELKSIKIAVVGPATAQCVQAYGLSVAFMAPQYHAEAAAQAFAAQYAVNGLRILWPCGNLAHPALPKILKAAGAHVTTLVVYKTRLKSALTPEERALLGTPWDLLVFTSPSAIEAWVGLWPQLGQPMGSSVSPAPVATLGPKTTQAARRQLGRADVQADPHTLEGLAQAISTYFTEETT